MREEEAGPALLLSRSQSWLICTCNNRVSSRMLPRWVIQPWWGVESFFQSGGMKVGEIWIGLVGRGSSPLRVRTNVSTIVPSEVQGQLSQDHWRAGLIQDNLSISACMVPMNPCVHTGHGHPHHSHCRTKDPDMTVHSAPGPDVSMTTGGSAGYTDQYGSAMAWSSDTEMFSGDWTDPGHSHSSWWCHEYQLKPCVS